MKVNIGVGIALVVLILIFLLIVIPKHHPTYKLEIYPCEQKQAATTDSINSVKIYLETSMSMKGYVNEQDVDDYGYIIRSVVPILITDCRENLCQPELWTISNAPGRYKNSREEFIRNLRDGTLMRQGNTQIHKIFERIIESNRPNELSFLISDCIPDLGAGQTMSELNVITTTIYDFLRSNEDISAAVFQYYSEFNGDWYYDSRGWARPFNGQNITMHGRPLYIWIFGKSELIDEALKQELLSESKVNFQNCYFYRDEFCFAPKYTLLSYPTTGKIAISESDSTITIVKLSQKLPVSFTIGLDLSNVPRFVRKAKFLSENLKFDKAYLNANNEIRVYNLDSIKSDPYYSKIAATIASHSLTHFITITMSNLNSVQDKEFSLVLKNNEPDWIEDAYIYDDLSIPAEELERKTFAYRYISEGLRLRFYSGDIQNIFEIKFKLISKK